jgi:hypothetical protein
VLPAARPILQSLQVEALLLEDGGRTILASSDIAATCPRFRRRSDRVHSRYARSLADLPRSSVAVSLRVRVRGFFCANDACPTVTRSASGQTCVTRACGPAWQRSVG